MRSLALVLIVLSGSAFALSACGESAEKKAQKQVCDARADIQNQVDALRSLTISSSIKDDLTKSVDAIRDDISKIKDAQPDLKPARKQQVDEATQTFNAQLQQILTSSLDNLTLANAPAQLKSAVDSLAAAYRESLQPIDC